MHLTLWQILVLSVIQGITEFLPISSSGHLVLAAEILSSLGVADPSRTTEALNVADLSIALHLGTLLSILVFYRRRVFDLLGEDRRLIGLLAIGTLPAVAVGLPLKLYADELLESPMLAACMLVVTGGVLLLAARITKGDIPYQKLNGKQSLLIGLSQAFALLPGVSRSGMTITIGLSQGLSPKSAATYSFLLAIPAIAGAGVLEIISLATKAHSATPWGHLAMGAFVSFVVGLGSLSWLVRWLEKGRIQWFAWWCIPVGLAAIVWRFFT